MRLKDLLNPNITAILIKSLLGAGVFTRHLYSPWGPACSSA